MTQDKEINDFVTELFLLYPPGKDFSTKEALDAKIRQYRKLLTSYKLYDYDKLLDIIGLEYKFKTTPDIAWIIELRNSRCERYREIQQQVYFVLFESGFWMQFVCTDFGVPFKGINEKLEKCYGKIQTTKLFPEGTTILQGNSPKSFNIYSPKVCEMITLDFAKK